MKDFKIGKEMLDVQGMDGNWNYDPYMHGLYNGMEYMLSLIEEREPEFKNAPKKWKKESYLRYIFRKLFKKPEYEEVNG